MLLACHDCYFDSFQRSQLYFVLSACLERMRQQALGRKNTLVVLVCKRKNEIYIWKVHKWSVHCTRHVCYISGYLYWTLSCLNCWKAEIWDVSRDSLRPIRAITPGEAIRKRRKPTGKTGPLPGCATCSPFWFGTQRVSGETLKSTAGSC